MSSLSKKYCVKSHPMTFTKSCQQQKCNTIKPRFNICKDVRMTKLTNLTNKYIFWPRLSGWKEEGLPFGRQSLDNGVEGLLKSKVKASKTKINIGVVIVPTNLISFPTTPFLNLISFPKLPYTGGGGRRASPGNFCERLGGCAHPPPDSPLKLWFVVYCDDEILRHTV